MREYTVGRRSFLAAGAAAIGTLAIRPGFAAAAEDGPNLGIQMYSLRGFKVDEALGHVKDLGLKCVEFYSGMFPITDDTAAIDAMKKKVADLGLTISAHGVNRFTKDDAANRKIFVFAKAAGIGILGADPDPDSFASLDGLVKEFDIRIAIHNHGPTHRYNKALDVLQAIEKHDSRIGACADLGHFLRSGEKPTEVIRLLAGRLYGIHLKDFAEMQDKTKGVILGKGHIDVPAVFAALEQAKFPADGALSIEYEENPKNPLDDIRQCILAAREAMVAA
ncbi:MAG: sugar phosphate isomerase/epimerase [Planctomycetia bacterium]|nr:sugar phosphate isomerase/epimerase [Planctomycetia bacterium]